MADNDSKSNKKKNIEKVTNNENFDKEKINEEESMKDKKENIKINKTEKDRSLKKDIPETIKEETKDSEKIEDSKKTEEKQAVQKKEEPIIEKPEEIEEKKKKETTKPKDIKTEKVKDETKDKKEKDDDFQYIIRIANTDIDGHKNVVNGLTAIKGIGMLVSTFIVDQSGIKRDKKVGDLSDKEVKSINNVLDGLNENLPPWMVNHRKDMDTGDDIHLIGSEIDMRLRDEINVMKKIRSYKGIRHERGLRCRGQRTRTNNRSGLTLGVSKRRG